MKLSQVAPGQMCFAYDLVGVRSWCGNVIVPYKGPMLVVSQMTMTDREDSVWPITKVLTQFGPFFFTGASNVTLDDKLRGFERASMD